MPTRRPRICLASSAILNGTVLRTGKMEIGDGERETIGGVGCHPRDVGEPGPRDEKVFKRCRELCRACPPVEEALSTKLATKLTTKRMRVFQARCIRPNPRGEAGRLDEGRRTKQSKVASALRASHLHCCRSPDRDNGKSGTGTAAEPFDRLRAGPAALQGVTMR